MLKQIEARIQASKYDIVVLTGNIPKEILVGMPHAHVAKTKQIRIRYAKRNIDTSAYTSTSGWIASTFNYESVIGDLNTTLIIDYHKFIGRDKAELRKVIRMCKP